MATGFAIAGAVIGIGSAIMGRNAQRGSANAQWVLDQENIRLEKLETAESIRRTEESQEFTESTAKTQIGASGFASGGSMGRYMSTMEAKHATDVDWMKTSGASRTAIASREAAARHRAGLEGSKATLVSGVGQAVGSAGSAAGAYSTYGWGFNKR